MKGMTHLLNAFRWTRTSDFDAAKELTPGISMAIPVLVGAATGHLSAGFAASAGAFVVGAVGSGTNLKSQTKMLVASFTPTAVAVIVASAVAGLGWRTDAAVVLIVFMAATLGSYSRAMIVASARLVLTLIILVNLADAAANQAGFLVLLASGAILAVALNLILGGMVRARKPIDRCLDTNAASGGAASRKFARWKQSLRHLSGWQYPLRLVSCLAVAVGLQSVWPNHHFYWVALTVALLCQRQIETLPLKTTQRAIGTALGVIVASVIVAGRPAIWVVVICFAVLALVRPLLRTRNYLAYSTVMTPLVILLMDAGHQVELAVVLDRLVATLAGAALVITTNRIFAGILKAAP
jgi:hypothetical protein